MCSQCTYILYAPPNTLSGNMFLSCSAPVTGLIVTAHICWNCIHRVSKMLIMSEVVFNFLKIVCQNYHSFLNKFPLLDFIENLKLELQS